jgi:hypothetical protein
VALRGERRRAGRRGALVRHRQGTPADRTGAGAGGHRAPRRAADAEVRPAGRARLHHPHRRGRADPPGAEPVGHTY